MGYVKGKGGRWKLEDVAQLMVRRRKEALGYVNPDQFIAEEEADEPKEDPRKKVTLPRVWFLERPYPDWWNEPIPVARKLTKAG